MAVYEIDGVLLEGSLVAGKKGSKEVLSIVVEPGVPVAQAVEEAAGEVRLL